MQKTSVADDLKNCPLVVFVGGEGKRMHGLTESTNKVLLPFKKGTILSNCLKPFLEFGFRKIIFLTNYRSDEVEEYVSNFLPVDIDSTFIYSGESINEGLKKTLPLTYNGVVTLHGNLILKKSTVEMFFRLSKSLSNNFILLSTKREINFFSGHPYFYSNADRTICTLGIPKENHPDLRTVVGLNYMSNKALEALNNLGSSFEFPEHLLVKNLIDFGEVQTSSRVKHFETKQDLL